MLKNSHPKGQKTQELFICCTWMARASQLHWETYAATYSQGVEGRIQLLSVEQTARCQRRPSSPSAFNRAECIMWYNLFCNTNLVEFALIMTKSQTRTGTSLTSFSLSHSCHKTFSEDSNTCPQHQPDSVFLFLYTYTGQAARGEN